jgi:periplasmic divalent cation tolerance protein
MKRGEKGLLALVTAPDLKVARKLATLALEKRLVACANLVPRIESHYWWRGRMEKSQEFLILFKTTAGMAGELEKAILENHPYDTPEFVVVDVKHASKKYLDWWLGSVEDDSHPDT